MIISLHQKRYDYFWSLVLCLYATSVVPLRWALWSVLVWWFPPVRRFLSFCPVPSPSRWQLHAPPAQVALGPTFAWVGTLWESRLHVHRTQRPYICKGGFARLELSYVCLCVLLLSLVLSWCLVFCSLPRTLSFLIASTCHLRPHIVFRTYFSFCL